jgi:hypothetical protein
MCLQELCEATMAKMLRRRKSRGARATFNLEL